MIIALLILSTIINFIIFYKLIICQGHKIDYRDELIDLAVDLQVLKEKASKYVAVGCGPDLNARKAFEYHFLTSNKIIKNLIEKHENKHRHLFTTAYEKKLGIYVDRGRPVRFEK